jgi:hypothetical protein
MHKLTNRQEVFAQAIAGGACQSKAYRLAFPSSNNWKPESVHNKASALARNGEVLARVEILKKEMAVQALWKRQQSIQVLIHIADTSEKASEIIAAVKVLNVMHGYDMPERIDHTSAKGNMILKPAIDVSKLSESTLAEILAAKRVDRA